jgi:drug/metabolite transporter (DMT)-like permease
MTLPRPSTGDFTRLSIAMVFISISGPLIAATAAAPLAIAFWRCFLGGGATGLWVALRERAALQGLTGQELRRTVLAGVLLGLHFATWIPSLSFTSVSSSIALVATQPIWAALIARILGYRIPVLAWIGIALAMGGVVFLSGVDFAIDSRSLIGNALALIGAILAASYVSVTERVRRTVPTATMTFVLYLASAITVLPILLLVGQDLVGFELQAWLMIIALTAGAQLLGHTLLNSVVARTSATVVSLAILFELPGATLVAAIWLGQTPPLAVYPAMIMILIGLVMVIRSSGRQAPMETSPI